MKYPDDKDFKYWCKIMFDKGYGRFEQARIQDMFLNKLKVWSWDEMSKSNLDEAIEYVKSLPNWK